MATDDGFQLKFAGSFTLAFLFVAGLVLWPMGYKSLYGAIAWGYVVFWAVLFLGYLMLLAMQRIFRIESDPPSNAFVLTNLAAGAAIQAGWAAFAVLAVRRSLLDLSLIKAVTLWAVGLASTYVAFVNVSAFFRGSIYRMINAFTALAAFIVFGLFPTTATMAYGWFLRLF